MATEMDILRYTYERVPSKSRGGEQRIFDPLPNPLEAVQLCQVLKKLPRLVSIRIQMVVLRNIEFQVVLKISPALCPHSCAHTSLRHEVENL